MIKVAIFASGEGTNFENIIQSHISCIEITLLITDKICNALKIADSHGIEHKTFLRNTYATKHIMEEEIAKILKEKEIDLIILAGYMRLFSKWFVEQFPHRIINIHPSLLPLYKGKGAIQQAILDGKKIYGVSVHYVNEEMDEGEIIAQIKVPYDGFDLEELLPLVHKSEYLLYPKVIEQICKEIAK